MMFKLVGGPMDGAVYCLSRESDQPSTTRKPDGLWFDGKDDCGHDVQHQYRDTGLIDLPLGVAITYTYNTDITTPYTS